MQKKKILFIISRLSIGGAQKSLIKALENIDFNRYDVDLYVRENKLDLIKDIPREVNLIVNDDENNYEYKLIPLFGEVIKRIGIILKQKKISQFAENFSREYIVKRKYNYEYKNFFKIRGIYDIAISYMNGYTCRFVIDYVKAKRKICFYLGSTDNLPELHKEYLPQYEKIVTDSKGSAKKLYEKIPQIKEKISIISNYIDAIEICRKAQVDNASEYYEGIVLCSCGRLSVEKGFKLAVESAKLLKKKGINFKWYFVGDGPEKQEIENLITKYDLENNIVMTGMKDNPYPYIKNCDIYIQPSYEESYGLTITEAKMLCKPIVSTCTVGANLQIDNMVNGIITEITSDSIANGIIRLLEDKSLKNMIINNLRNADYSDELITFKNKWKKLLEE